MAGATGKFQLTVADEDNFDKIMAAIGKLKITIFISAELCAHQIFVFRLD